MHCEELLVNVSVVQRLSCTLSNTAPADPPRSLLRARQYCQFQLSFSFSSEHPLRALLACSTMSAKSAISKEIFAPLDERMLGAVQVKRRTKKKIPFLATGGQGEYLTYICLSGNEN